jgi:hypothetical protein
MDDRAERQRLEQVVLAQQDQLKKLESRCDRLAETNVRLNKRLGQLEGAQYRDREPYRESRLDDGREDAVLVAQRIVQAVPGIRWDGVQLAPGGRRLAMLTDVASESSGWLPFDGLSVQTVRAWAAEVRQGYAR